MGSLTPEAYAVIEGRHSDPFRYLGPRVENGSSVVRRQVEIEDPYRFPPILSDLDLYLLGEGRHMHPKTFTGGDIRPHYLDGVISARGTIGER
jgi:1,4-alpha-glucan branching enzyme